MSNRRVYPNNPSVPTGPSPGYHGNLPHQGHVNSVVGVANKMSGMNLGMFVKCTVLPLCMQFKFCVIGKWRLLFHADV